MMTDDGRWWLVMSDDDDWQNKLYISRVQKNMHIYFKLPSSDDGYTDFCTNHVKLLERCWKQSKSESLSLGLCKEACELPCRQQGLNTFKVGLRESPGEIWGSFAFILSFNFFRELFFTFSFLVVWNHGISRELLSLRSWIQRWVKA